MVLFCRSLCKWSQGLGCKQLVIVLWWCRRERDVRLSINPSQWAGHGMPACWALHPDAFQIPGTRASFGFLISVKQRSYGRPKTLPICSALFAGGRWWEQEQHGKKGRGRGRRKPSRECQGARGKAKLVTDDAQGGEIPKHRRLQHGELLPGLQQHWTGIYIYIFFS